MGEASALALGLWTVGMLVWGHIELVVLVFYGFATLLSIVAGRDIANRVAPRAVGRRAIVQYLNDNWHKWFVAVLNGIVFAGTLYRLVVDTQIPHDRRIGSLAVLGMFAAAYIASYLFRAVRAHSVLARFRSAVLRAILTMVMADLLWGPTGMVVIAGMDILLLMLTWSHLLRERDRWGWDLR